MSVHNLTGKPSRSGKQHTYTGEGYDSWNGLSPNGRQYKNETTNLTRDLSGAAYWHLRKELSPNVCEKEVISADDYKTPSYYHVKKETNVLSEKITTSDNILSVDKSVVKTKESIFSDTTFVITVVGLSVFILCRLFF